MHCLLFKDMHVVESEPLTILAINSLKLHNPLNIFFNSSNHLYRISLTSQILKVYWHPFNPIFLILLTKNSFEIFPKHNGYGFKF